MTKLSILACSTIFLTACAGLMPDEQSRENIEHKTFAYNYQVPDVDREELWRRARGYFDATLADNQSDFEIEDRAAGTLTGRGLASWRMSREYCSAEYHIRFQAQDEEARLELQLIEDVLPFRECSGFGWPGKEAEEIIASHFESLSEGLGEALQGY